MTSVVIFYGSSGPNFNPTNSELLTELDIFGVMARTPIELDEELETWGDKAVAFVVSATSTIAPATTVLGDLAARSYDVPCLVHGIGQKTYDNKRWADVAPTCYDQAEYVERNPNNWPDEALRAFFTKHQLISS